MALPLSYNVRNVRSRWQVTLLAVSGIALVVAVFTVLMSMSEGFAIALRSTGRPDNAMIVQRGSASELTSWIPIEHRNLIVVREEIARAADGQPLASPEDVVVTSNGRVRLVDFGLWTSGGRRLLGRATPFYLAPEQWNDPSATSAVMDTFFSPSAATQIGMLFRTGRLMILSAFPSPVPCSGGSGTV